MKKHYTKLRLILGDQLNADHSWYADIDPDCLYVMAELKQETGYVKHHIQKLCGFFLAIQNFADSLEKSGHQVIYFTLDDTVRFSDLPDLLNHLCKQYAVSTFEYQRPDEYRLLQQLRALNFSSAVTVNEVDTEHFFVQFDELYGYFPAGKPGRMETFYRKMRRKHNILMNQTEPEGGQWNYDTNNRNKLKAADLSVIPAPLLFANSVRTVLDRLQRHQVDSIGRINDELLWPVNRQQSLQLLSYFCQHCLPAFGQFQDAMTSNSTHQWSLYHSRLSFALNTKMLSPAEVVTEAINSWQQQPDSISLPEIEGFVRQILGWREYIRGVYWSNMPDYESLNHLNATRSLPDWFWTGETKMNCLSHAITQSLDYAYAHHIQRLMITGNLCLLAGIDPDEVDAWYMGIYIDAIQWVELPNTRGMSQYADGGMVASKPYAASGNYVQKMSDYCSDCHYQVKEKDTDLACPLNSLYWHFMERNRAVVKSNPRTALVYKGWDKRDESFRQAVLMRAEWCLDHIEQL
ncbi:deoxyribodipyrimidine photolyase [Endozoicomonas montiporae]|uniref:Deoxyribodipyrimidine photolyase n=2 Tax=Endozoicomonas montiporae TaxID=1027273 RepID=A0A081NB02_9GAMM|nr:cryptochrome/photolyase family protein [Endozoicomonas montiporae]AMO56676.1 deoxyribodipyrimidine photolyase-like protein [Endozoicomonas montiporae CL-33]KEQ15625.1 deoxyribodipyrimidine photolyase [Endozoicomonas montiporae]